MNWTRRLTSLIVGLVGIVLVVWMLLTKLPQAYLLEGVFWQTDNVTARPHGNWQLLGASTLAVQWMAVDQKAWFSAPDMPQWERQPDWNRITQEPWAQQVIAGLSGRYSEPDARKSLAHLKAESLKIASSPLPFKPAGYYFPVEADPSWFQVNQLKKVLNELPRPLWISVYAGERSPENFDMWLQSWLPDDVNVFFQDGVGVGVRNPAEARQIADQLIQRLGKERVRIVLEAFQPASGGGFKPASFWQLTRQFQAYCGLRVYAFDGPHYLSDFKVRLLQLWALFNEAERCSH